MSFTINSENNVYTVVAHTGLQNLFPNVDLQLFFMNTEAKEHCIDSR
jgi:hypothetical protein